jgi:hypothetical protein
MKEKGIHSKNLQFYYQIVMRILQSFILLEEDRLKHLAMIVLLLNPMIMEDTLIKLFKSRLSLDINLETILPLEELKITVKTTTTLRRLI